MRKVLIACHLDSITNILKRNLHNCDVHISTTGADALAQTERLKPDILLIHLSLPNTDGLTVLRKISHKPSVIIALTNLVANSVIQAAAEAGVQELALLPCSVAYLNDVVRKYLPTS